MMRQPLIVIALMGAGFGTVSDTIACDHLRCRLLQRHSRLACCVGYSRCESQPVASCNGEAGIGESVCAPIAIQENSSVEAVQQHDSADGNLFAQIVAAIEQSTTVTYTVTAYTRWTSKDGQRTWLQAMNRSELAYQAPSFYRDTRYDGKGNVSLVQIVDATTNKTLHLDMNSKRAMWMDAPFNVYGEGHPLGGIAKVLENDDLKHIGPRETGDASVDVYRLIRKPNQTSFDLWIDASARRVVRISDPGADRLDLADVLEGDDLPKRKDRGRGRMAGFVRSDIAIDPPLAKELFSMVPPEGFELVDAPPMPGAVIVE